MLKRQKTFRSGQFQAAAVLERFNQLIKILLLSLLTCNRDTLCCGERQLRKRELFPQGGKKGAQGTGQYKLTFSNSEYYIKGGKEREETASIVNVGIGCKVIF